MYNVWICVHVCIWFLICCCMLYEVGCGNFNDYLNLNKECTCTCTIYLILPYTDVCTALYTRCFPTVCETTSQATRAGFEPTTSLLTSADVLTSRPPSLPDDDRLARILYSSGFHDIYRLMKFLRRVINNWFHFAYIEHVHVQDLSYHMPAGATGWVLYLSLAAARTHSDCKPCMIIWFLYSGRISRCTETAGRQVWDEIPQTSTKGNRW